MVPTNLIPERWSYYGCDQEDEANIQRLWETQGELVRGKASQVADAGGQLQLMVERSDEAPIWTMQAVLHLPGATLTARGSAQTMEQSLEAMMNSLAEEIDRHQERPIQVVQRHQGLDGLDSLLRDLREKDRSEAFISLLFPVVASLGPYIRRELEVRQIQGKLPTTQTTPQEVLNEVILKAWEEFPQRKGALDLWLMRLADQALEQFGTESSEVSTDQQVAVPSTEPRQAQRDEWVDQVSYFERMELGQLLPTGSEIDDWDQNKLEVSQQQLAELLGGMPWERRQALVLNTVFGFNTVEIADFQERSVAQVETDLAEGTSQIRHNFLVDETVGEEEPVEEEDVIRERKRQRGQH